ncbi:MAG: hypothetical protein WCJ58_00785 [bacterium]
MKIFTQEEFDALPLEQFGRRIVPAFSDLRLVKNFGNSSCSFGEYCSFGEDCSFGSSCSFGEYCRFGENCSFGKYCSFGEDCSFGEGCKLFDLKIINYKAVDRIGNSKQKLYCWNLENNLYFRAGCFFGKKDELLEKVEKEYRIGSEYHLAVDFLEKLITFKVKE